LLLHDDFSNGFNTDVWTREVRLDGYGNGDFEWTTNSENNSFVKDGTLYLVPTLSSDVLGAEAIFNGYTLNLTADGTCTSENFTECVAVSNSSRLQVINPVQSARLTTKHSVNIRYGKVEVKARRVTGCGQGSFCYRSTRRMALGREVGRSICWKRGGITRLTRIEVSIMPNHPSTGVSRREHRAGESR